MKKSISCILLLLTAALFTGCTTLGNPDGGISGKTNEKIGQILVRFETALYAGSSDSIVGTGFFFYDPTMVISCAHNFPDDVVIGDLIEGRQGASDSNFEVVHLDREKDLILLKSMEIFPPEVLPAAGKLHNGNAVFTGGFPTHIPDYEDVFFTGGIIGNSTPVEMSVSGISRKYYLSDVYATTGNSGGPLITAAGKIAGMVSAVLRDDENRYKGVTFITPVEDLEAFVEAFKTNEE